MCLLYASHFIYITFTEREEKIRKKLIEGLPMSVCEESSSDESVSINLFTANTTDKRVAPAIKEENDVKSLALDKPLKNM